MVSDTPPEYGNIETYLNALDRLVENGKEFVQGLDFESMEEINDLEEYKSLLERGRTSKAVAFLSNGQEKIEMIYNEL